MHEEKTKTPHVHVKNVPNVQKRNYGQTAQMNEEKVKV